MAIRDLWFLFLGVLLSFFGLSLWTHFQIEALMFWTIVMTLGLIFTIPFLMEDY